MRASIEALPSNWATYKNRLHTQLMGDDWVKTGSSAVMQVPSAIIPEEHNFLINPNHPDFQRIHIEDVQPFLFDHRL